MPDMTKRRTITPGQHESRIVRAEFRADPSTEGRITARVLTYGTVDTYKTTFAKGVFNTSMQERMPRIVWSHDWSDVIGVWQTFTEDDGGLTLTGQLDMDMIPGTSVPAVPRAHQAWAQLQSGSIDQFSVGFWPEEAREVIMDGEDILEFTRGILDEASLVMVGAVPGTKLLSLRSARHDLISRLAAADEDMLARVTAVLDDEDTLEDDDTDDDGGTPPQATGEATLTDDDDDDDEPLDWSVEDVQAWALLADTGDALAAEELQAIADEYGENTNDWATWTEFVADVLVDDSDALLVGDESDDDADDDTLPPAGADSDTADEISTELEAEIEAALALVDELP